MLKHEPLGVGHPYRTEPFELTPHHPATGETLVFRVCSNQETERVTLCLEFEGVVELFEMHRIGPAYAHDLSNYGSTAKEFVSDSHLADAAARSGEYSHLVEWRIERELPRTVREAKYWFKSDIEVTPKFLVKIHDWLSPVKSKIDVRGDFPQGVFLINEKWLVDDSGLCRKIKFSLPLMPGEKVIGFGERFHSVVQNGELVDAIVYEEYKGQGHRTYLPTPFAHVVGGNYGFHVNTSAPAYFDVGRTNRELTTVEVDIPSDLESLELDFYHGSPANVLKGYLSDIGDIPLPPEWIYDLWISSNEWNTQERVRSELAASLESGIYPGVVVLEAWSDESTFTVFRDAHYSNTNGKEGLSNSDISYPADGAWPDPKAMIDDLHEKDIRLILWQIPVIKDSGTPGSQAEVNWNFAISNNMIVKDGLGEPYKVRGFWFQDGLLPDLTSPAVREWWGEQRRYLVEDLGVDGFKTDGGEHAWGADLQYLDGQLGLVKNNQFPVGYAQTFHELLRMCGKWPVTFSRAGYSGSQKFPTFWAGDENSTWQALRASIIAGISASASGFFFWGWDIGGFSGEIPSAELYLRGTAMATFCPIMQIHSEFNHHQVPSNDRTPWNLAKRHNDPKILSSFRRFAGIRKSLIPYLSSEAENSVVSGRPLMAGLFFDFPDDVNIWSVPYQYLLGRDLLVAPVVEGSTSSLEIYLPDGVWVDFFTQETINGGRFISREVPLTEIAVFVKEEAWAKFQKISPSIGATG